MAYNATIQGFLEKNGIDKKNIPEVLNRTLNSPSDETILSSFLYAMYTPIEKRRISVASIYGSNIIEYFRSKNQKSTLMDILGEYFDKEGNEYLSRSVSMLEYQGLEMLEKTKNSFERDPVYILAIEDKNYITINGNHRTLLLLFHYLYALSKHPEKEEELTQTFQIPVRMEYLNLEFSLIQYLLKMKYGKEYQKDSITLKDDIITFKLKGEKKQMNFLEFRLFALNEISRKTCSFIQLRELYQIMILNAKQDSHFKSAMEKLFENFSKLDLEKIEILLQYTNGYEKELESLPSNLSLIEYIEVIKEALLQLKVQESKKQSQERNKIEETLESLEQQKRKIEKELVDITLKQAQESSYHMLEIDYPKETLESLEEQELSLKQQIEQLKKKSFVFLKRKKMNTLLEQCHRITEELDTNILEMSITRRQFLEYLRKKDSISYSLKEEQLRQQLLGIMVLRKHNLRKLDGLNNQVQLKCFCLDCGISFELVCQQYFAEQKRDEEENRCQKRF